MSTSPGAPLPDSGDGLAPPRPDELPHPALWSDPLAGEAPVPYDGQSEDDVDVPQRTPARLAATWGAVAAMVVAAALLGVAVVRGSLVLAVVAVVLGLAGLVTALKAQILSAVSVGQSPTGPG